MADMADFTSIPKKQEEEPRPLKGEVTIKWSALEFLLNNCPLLEEGAVQDEAKALLKAISEIALEGIDTIEKGTCPRETIRAFQDHFTEQMSYYQKGYNIFMEVRHLYKCLRQKRQGLP